MLADKDRIFLNLYGAHGADLESAKKRGAWNGTKAMVERGMKALVGSDDSVEAWRSFFKPGDRVGIKVVPVGKPAIAALEAYLKELRPQLMTRRGESPNVFVSRHGKPLTRIELWRVIRKYARRAGITGKVSPPSVSEPVYHNGLSRLRCPPSSCTRLDVHARCSVSSCAACCSFCCTMGSRAVSACP